jgi:hypothetical protein
MYLLSLAQEISPVISGYLSGRIFPWFEFLGFFLVYFVQVLSGSSKDVGGSQDLQPKLSQ